MNHVRALCACVLLAATLTSCTVPAKQAEERDANGNKIEYVYYTPTGSNVPIRVRKDALKTSASDTDAQQRAFGDLQRESGSATTPSGAGGR